MVQAIVQPPRTLRRHLRPDSGVIDEVLGGVCPTHAGGIDPFAAITGGSTRPASAYFRPVPVLSTSTRSSSLIQLASRNCSTAVSAAVPSGHRKIPSFA